MTAQKCKLSGSETLSAYADGMLDGQSLRRTARHLDDCADCRRALQEIIRLQSILRAARTSGSAGSAPRAFWNNAHRAARLSGSAPRPVSIAAPPKWRLATLTGIGAAVIALSLLPGSMQRASIMQPADAAQVIDVNTLVSSHASMTSGEPLADQSRCTTIFSDSTSRQADGSLVDTAYSPDTREASDAAGASD